MLKTIFTDKSEEISSLVHLVIVNLSDYPHKDVKSTFIFLPFIS